MRGFLCIVKSVSSVVASAVKKPSTIARGRLSVNCSDWPELTVCPPGKEGHFAVKSEPKS